MGEMGRPGPHGLMHDDARARNERNLPYIQDASGLQKQKRTYAGFSPFFGRKSWRHRDKKFSIFFGSRARNSPVNPAPTPWAAEPPRVDGTVDSA